GGSGERKGELWGTAPMRWKGPTLDANTTNAPPEAPTRAHWGFMWADRKNIMSVAAAGMTASWVSAYIQPIIPPMPPIEFPYNPGKYSITTKGNWKGSIQPATNGPEPQWLGVSPPELDVEMLLDAFSVPPIPPSVVITQLKLLTLPT